MSDVGPSPARMLNRKQSIDIDMCVYVHTQGEICIYMADTYTKITLNSQG